MHVHVHHSALLVVGLQAGSILETRDCREWTALFHAVHAGQRGSVHTLLRHRANANAW